MNVESAVAFGRPAVAIASGAVATAIVLLISHGSFIALSRRYITRKNGYGPLTDLYEDCDGKATEETQQNYLAYARIPTMIALLITILGLGVSIVALVFQIRHGQKFVVVDGSLRLASWVLLCFQAIHIRVEYRPTVRFRSGIFAMISAVVILAELVGVFVSCVQLQPPSDAGYKLLFALAATQAGLAIVSAITFVTIPRRPMLYSKTGRPVDAEFTVSALSRTTFSYAIPLLVYVRKNKKLTLEEIPDLADYARADTLQRTYNAEKKEGRRLWLQVLVYLRWAFIKQMTLISIVSVVQFIPQLAMYNLLKLLEKRSNGGTVAPVAWLWVLGLFFAMVANQWVEAFLFWIVMGQLAIPCRNLLSTLVFLKSTRRKDVKGVEGGAKRSAAKAVDGEDVGLAQDQVEGEGDPDVDVGEKEGDEDLETMQKSRQNTVNLVGVDTNRVADFCSYVYIFPGTVVKLAVSFTFLYTLVGALPLLAGVIAFFAALPLNILFSSRYNKLQGILMKMRDIKMAVVTETLQGIRQIKVSAMENQWQGKINEKRQNELDTLWKSMIWDSLLIGIYILGPVMLAAALLATYALVQGHLVPSIAFTAVAILGSIEGTLAVVPELTTDAIDAWVSLARIEDYLNAPEKTDCLTPSDVIALKNASIAWPADSQQEDPDRFMLRNIDLEFPKGELSVITGRTGAGKSLLLASLLGEVDKIGGIIEMPKSPPPEEQFNHKATKDNWIIDSAVAYVAQSPWIENATVKENITWGLPTDNVRYTMVKMACALEKDLEMLEDGDLTDIGANGINLSGGQRWRISFARALYSRAGILVLDDIFSAVDAHVGRQLLDEALTGKLGEGRTRVLVTHHIGLCISKTKYTVKLEDGRVVHAGLVDELRRLGQIDDVLKDDAAVEEEQEAEEEAEAAIDEPNGDGTPLRLILSRRRSSAAVANDESTGAAMKKKPAPKNFTEAEGRETGRIKTHVYAEYIRASGGWRLWVPLFTVFLMNMVLPLSRSYWITIWTRSYRTESDEVVSKINPLVQDLYLQMPLGSNATPSYAAQASPSANSDLWFYLGIYLALSVATVFIGTLKYFVTYVASIRASKKLFEQMSFVILRAPLRWLDTVPVGRILNRFSSDFNQVDSRISNVLAVTLYRALEVVAITVTAFFVTPILILVALVLLVLVLAIALYYLSGAREIKRLESVSKSPIFEQFGSVLAGIGTIRAFGKADDYSMRMYGKIDAFARAHFHNWLFNRWMSLQLNFIGATFALVVASVIVSTDIDASLAGFVLSFALGYSGAIINTIRGYANLEMVMNAAERIVEYAGLPTEDLGGKQPPAAWPSKGRVEVSGLIAAYAPELPNVLKGLTFTVEPHERIGVIGRTGAGKSTLSLALWRFIHIREGTVHVDGIDTSTMSLHDLRARLAIIPQDPVLFSGTVRSNLDPFSEHTDDELRDALQRVHLIPSTSTPSRAETLAGHEASGPEFTPPPTATDSNTNIFRSLSSKISEGGLSLSQGQRQLLCLARAIVRKPKVMLLDEATSAVDMATDVLIQRSIREEFSDSTLLVIAHRLSTIADFDRILVMSEGRAVEYDTPKALWERKGVFYDMCCTSGEKDLLERIVGAAEK